MVLKKSLNEHWEEYVSVFIQNKQQREFRKLCPRYVETRPVTPDYLDITHSMWL